MEKHISHVRLELQPAGTLSKYVMCACLIY